jgi:hypothetical protein
MTRVRPAHVLLKWQLPYLKVSDSRLIGPIFASIAALVSGLALRHSVVGNAASPKPAIYCPEVELHFLPIHASGNSRGPAWTGLIDTIAT